MSEFIIRSTAIDGLAIIERQPAHDDRGFFERLYCHHDLDQFLRGKKIRQINRSLTKHKGTVRGLHYQHPPYAEDKIITCVKGKVWDVAVDVRRGSPTFLKHHAITLTDSNHLTYFIPAGFAHGFQALSEECEMLYLHTADFNAESSRALNAVDPALDIDWPTTITKRSMNDSSLEMLTEEFTGVSL